MGANDCCCGRYDAAEGTKIIGIVSTVFAALSLIGCIWKFVKLKDAENQLMILLDPVEYEKIRESVENQKTALSVMIGISILCIVVSALLILAVKKRSYCLCLPYMIVTILIQIAAGIFIAILIFFLAVGIPAAKTDKDVSSLVEVFGIPLIYTVIQFALNTWWLIVVFAFYRLLKNGHAFDSIPMQTA